MSKRILMEYCRNWDDHTKPRGALMAPIVYLAELEARSGLRLFSGIYSTQEKAVTALTESIDPDVRFSYKLRIAPIEIDREKQSPDLYVTVYEPREWDA